MDLIRTCYRAVMRMWDGDHERLVPVRWFRCEPGALDFPGPHSFWSYKGFERGAENGGPGEDLRFGTAYDKGNNPLGYRGVGFCGSGLAALDGGVWGRDPPIFTRHDGWADGCGPALAEAAGERLGGAAVFYAYAPPRALAGLVVGGTGYGPGLYGLPKAKEAGAVVYYPALLRGQLPKARQVFADVRYPHAAGAGLPKARQGGAAVRDVVRVSAGLLKAKQGAATTRDVVAMVAALPKAKQGSATGRDILRVSAGLPKARQLIATVETMPTLNSVFGCRLSAQSGTSCPAADFAGVTRIYLEPHTSNQVALYSGGAWSILPVGVVFLDLAVTAGKVYDVFAYNNGGAVALELGPAWTNDALRSAFLARQDGVWVRQSDNTRRWVGTLRASIANGTDDSARQRWLWNAHNQEPRPLRWAGQASNATYSVQAWRQVAASAANYVSVVRGNDERPVVLTALMLASNTLDYPSYTGVGVDSSTVNSAAIRAGSGQRSAGDVCVAEYVGYPGAGYHELRWLEFGAATGVSVDFYSGAVEGQGGLQGFVWA
jgi:hypothetical protein